MRQPTTPARAQGERELSRLDPWSFHVLPDDGVGCDRVVVGTTGAFAVVFDGEGVPSGRVKGVGRARRAARKLKGLLRAIGLQSESVGVLCPETHAVFAPRSVRGVRVIPKVLLASEIADRSRTTMPHQVKRAAESLARSFAQSQ